MRLPKARMEIRAFFVIIAMNEPLSLLQWRQQVKLSGKKLVTCTGCFDILHKGHLSYLKAAKEFGDVLLVGINSDASVRQLKGSTRPINNELDRKEILDALKIVDFSFIYNNTARFLTLVQADVWVKGGDYTLETLNKEEVEAVSYYNGEIKIIPYLSGYSTTNILKSV